MASDREPNFYQLMLGLPAEVWEPNHYQLLGIDPKQAETQTIRDAAADQNGKLMGWQNSKYYKKAGELMMELAVARGVLLDPEKKQSYDESVGLSSGDEEPIILLEAAPEEEPIVLEAVAEKPARPRRVSNRKPRRPTSQSPADSPRKSNQPLPYSDRRLLLGGLFAVICLGAIGWSAWDRGGDENPSPDLPDTVREDPQPLPPTPKEPLAIASNEEDEDDSPNIETAAKPLGTNVTAEFLVDEFPIRRLWRFLPLMPRKRVSIKPPGPSI